MRKRFGLITTFIILVSAALAQYSKYDVLDYFWLIPKEYLNLSFLNYKGTETTTDEEYLDKHVIQLPGTVVDTKNGYISSPHSYVQQLLNEFVVWKAKNKQDVIAISRGPNFDGFMCRASGCGLQVVSDNFYGIDQTLTFYRFNAGRWFVYDSFRPSKETMMAIAKKKYPSLFSNIRTGYAYLLPRFGSTIRIVMFQSSSKIGSREVIIKDLMKIAWDGYNLKVVK